MRTYKKLLLAAIASTALAPTLYAQVAPPPPPPAAKKDKSIIIRKSGDTKEKTTIVIDGDNVTINGKPVDEYKGDNLSVITTDEAPGMGGDRIMFSPGLPRDGMAWSGDNDMFKEIHSNKAFLGVMTKKTDKGAEITDVTKESAAEKAGLKPGDVITKVDDEKIEDADGLYKAIGAYKPGDKVTVTYMRDGKTTSVKPELGENKQVRVFSLKSDGQGGPNFNLLTPPGADNGLGGSDNFNYNFRKFFFENDKPRLGAQVQDTEDSKGVKVLDVDDDAAGGKAGLQEDDIITSVNGNNISSVDDLKKVMEDVKPGDSLQLNIVRDGKSMPLTVKFPKNLKTTDL